MQTMHLFASKAIIAGTHEFTARKSINGTSDKNQRKQRQSGYNWGN